VRAIRFRCGRRRTTPSSRACSGSSRSLAQRSRSRSGSVFLRSGSKHLRGENHELPAAYDEYLRGLAFANQRTPPTTQRAIEHYERATTLDPEYALAWSALADAHSANLYEREFRAKPVRRADGERERDAHER
jgi:hypothetical protein